MLEACDRKYRPLNVKVEKTEEVPVTGAAVRDREVPGLIAPF